MGEAGIPVLGYNFSIAGVAGRVSGPWGRGGAITVGMDGPVETPMPLGVAWNMVVDQTAPSGTVPSISHDELWRRLQRFLEEVVPVAESAGVRLAAHPDDPPMPTMRGQPRLVYQPAMYQRLLDSVPSPNNALEFCVGTLAEMTDGDIYETVDHYSRQGALPTSTCETSRARSQHTVKRSSTKATWTCFACSKSSIGMVLMGW